MLAVPLCMVWVGVAVAFIARFALAPSPHTFATVSNLSFGMAGLACTPAFQGPRRRLANTASRGALTLLVMGASSAAYHAQGSGGRGVQAHVLDIVWGWFLVMHLAHSSVAVAVRFAIHLVGCPAGGPTDRASDAVMWALLGTATVLLFSHYEELYANQIRIYVGLGIGCAVTTACNRLILAWSPTRHFTVPAIVMALIEAVVISLAIVAAVHVQGDLLGRELPHNRANPNQGYDLWHGNWHVLIAAVAVLVYLRLADVEALIDAQSDNCADAQPVTEWNVTDIVALLTLGTYAGLVWALKETAVDVDVAFFPVGAYVGIVPVLAAWRGWIWWNSCTKRGTLVTFPNTPFVCLHHKTNQNTLP